MSQSNEEVPTRVRKGWVEVGLDVLFCWVQVRRQKDGKIVMKVDNVM